MMEIQIVDVSSYQGTINWEKVKASGIDACILKVIRKDGAPDTRFEANWTGAEGTGMPIQGVYNYSYATTVAKAQRDAQRVLKILGDRKTMVWMDIEDACLKGLGHKLVDIINAYEEVISFGGCTFGIYTGKSFYETYLKRYESELKSKPFWIARYPSTLTMTVSDKPNESKRPSAPILYGWQYSSAGSVPGIAGKADLNKWYVSIEAAHVAIIGNYSKEDFVREMAGYLGCLPTPETVLRGAPTISSTKNAKHNCVTALERLLKAKGFYQGSIEADAGKVPKFGSGMIKATALFQSAEVGLKRPDSEWTKTKQTYKTALGV